MGTQDLPKTLQRRGGLALTCRGGAARAHAEPAGAVAGAPRPAAATVAGRARAAARLGLGSGSASRAAAAAGVGETPARLRPRRLAAAGAEAAAARPSAAGATTPAPGEEPCAPLTRALEVLARRSGRSCSHPGPASSGFPQLTPCGDTEAGGERDTPRSPRPAARAGIQNDPFLTSAFPALLPRGRRPWRTQRNFILPYIFPALIPSLS